MKEPFLPSLILSQAFLSAGNRKVKNEPSVIRELPVSVDMIVSDREEELKSKNIYRFSVVTDNPLYTYGIFFESTYI